MRGCLKFVVLPVLLLVAGYVLPGVLIPNGVDQFEGTNRQRAELVLAGVEGVWGPNDDDPEALVEALITTAYRIEEVGPCHGWPAEEPREPPPTWEPPMSPEQIEEEIRAEQPEEYRDYPIELFTELSHHRVKLYTLFGIPYATNSLTCDERR